MNLSKLLSWGKGIFDAPKEPITEASEKMANYIRKNYPPQERVLILQNVERHILSDLKTELKEAENVVTDYNQAIENFIEYKN